MHKIEFSVEGVPVPKSRPRFSSRNMRMYTPKRTSDYEKKIAEASAEAMAGKPPTEFPVKVSIRAYRKIPKKWNKDKKEKAERGEILPSMHGADLDNICKSCLDGMTGTVYADDCQIVGLSGRRMFSYYPRVEIEVTEICTDIA